MEGRAATLENPNPVVYDVQEAVARDGNRENRNEDEPDEFDSLEIFDILHNKSKHKTKDLLTAQFMTNFFATGGPLTWGTLNTKD